MSAIRWLAETWVQLGAGKKRKLKNAMKIVGRRKAEIADSSLEVLDQLDDPVKREKVKKLGDTIFAEFRAKGDAAAHKDAATFRNALYWELGLMTGCVHRRAHASMSRTTSSGQGARGEKLPR